MRKGFFFIGTFPEELPLSPPAPFLIATWPSIRSTTFQYFYHNISDLAYLILQLPLPPLPTQSPTSHHPPTHTPTYPPTTTKKRSQLTKRFVQMSTQSTSDSSHSAWQKPLLNMISGGIAGAVSRTATSPIERLKVLQQVQVNGVKTYSGVVGGLRAIHQLEGWKGYFKGNGSNVARIAPYSALQFLFFDWAKVGVRHIRGSRDEHGNLNHHLNSYERFLSGAFSGTASTLFCYPLDLVRSLLTVQTNQGKYNGITDCLQKVHAAEGIKGLFRGCVVTMAGITPYIAINFYVFDTLKQLYLPKDKNDPTFIYINLLLGAAAGGTAALLTYPSDVIRRRIQLLGSGNDMVKGLVGKPTIAACVREVVRLEGVPGLYKGLVACLLKVMPSMAISFTIHEQLRHRLGFKVD